jgi:hypothetical protein
MSYRAPRDLALDLALSTLLETQVHEGHYASVDEARLAVQRITQGSEAGNRDVTAEQAGETAL